LKASRVAWVFACLFSLPALTRAQPAPGSPRREAREEAGRMVDAYVLSNLQESLGLSEEQFVKILPLVKRLQSDRREAMARRRQTMGEMRRLLKSGSATEPQVLEKLNEMKAIEKEERGRATLDAIDAQLTPLQQAKFRVFESEVGQKLREMMGQLRRPNRSNERSERPGARELPEP
jgi:Spy/CpxP family protein refolding chaperone